MDLLIFDLDGTLIDSKLDLVHSVNATRAHMGMPPLSDDTVASYVGNGAPMLIRRAMGDQASEDDLKEALEFFIEHYREHALECTRLYPGVQLSLERLRVAGLRMSVLTNKPVRISQAIVAKLVGGGIFDHVYGGNSFDFKKPNPIGIEKLMEEFQVSRDCTMMVGDSSVDVLTARNAGVQCCGVTYGFQPETLTETRPDLLVDRMEDLADWVLQRRNGGSH
jgi:phosphoglycolate phosphatase